MACQKQLMQSGNAYPRTCPDCQFGPCKLGIGGPKAVWEDEAVAYWREDARTQSEILSMLLNFFTENGLLCGESVVQSDDGSIKGVEVLAEIADKLEFKIK